MSEYTGKLYMYGNAGAFRVYGIIVKTNDINHSVNPRVIVVDVNGLECQYSLCPNWDWYIDDDGTPRRLEY